jgi:glycosyltransferase involved in cell wall biosynthesis
MIGFWQRLAAGQTIRRALGVKLGRLHQYPPRDLSVARIEALDDESPDWPSIAIVTPSLNQARFLTRAIDSVLAQDYPRLQYVVQDGVSNDGSVALLQAYEHPALRIRVERDGGTADAINRAFALTDAELMGWLNSDDLYLPGTLRRVGRFFRDHPGIDVVYGNRLIMDESDREIGRWILPGHDERLLRFVDYVPQETMFWRRRLWERVGGCLDVDLRFAFDWDLILRFVQAHAAFCHLPELFGVFRVHGSQKTQSQLRSVGRPEMARVRAQYGGLQIPAWSRVWNHLTYLWRHHAAERRFEGALHGGTHSDGSG